MIRLTSAQAQLIRGKAEAAFPRECCGLLIGRRAADGAVLVDEVRPCRNLEDSESEDRFEIDPQDRFDAMRHAKSQKRDIVGHYHSHPNGVAHPSAADRKMMYEPELIWLIVGVQAGVAASLAAFRPNIAADDFDSVALVIANPQGQNSTP